MTIRHLALLALTLCLVGCTRYTTRGQGPFARRSQPAPQPTGLASTPTAPRSPLAMAGVNDPLPPAPVAETPIVPPRPPGSDVVPAGGVAEPDANADPNFDRRRRRNNEPDPAALPSPYAPKAPISPGPQAQPNANPAEQNLAELKRLLRIGTERWATMDSYEARVVRREVVKGKTTPTDELLFQFRQKPFSVYMKFIGEAGSGREVLYVQGMYKDQLQILTGPNDGLMAGKRLSLAPDSPLVVSGTRHGIREAGFGNALGRYARAIDQLETGKSKPDAMRYAGPTKRQEYGEHPLELVVRTLAPREDPQMPNGGTWHLYFDAEPKSQSYGFPILMILTDPRGAEIEYICHFDFRGPAGLTDADFNPDRLGKKK